MPVGAVPFPFGICRICKDKATGVHYGVATCEGCKGFFKRSITRGDKYKCFFGGECDVTPKNRNRCKSCRFKRCLDTGMSVDAVRMGRIPKVEKEKALEVFHQGGSDYHALELEVQQTATGTYDFQLHPKNDNNPSGRPDDQADNERTMVTERRLSGRDNQNCFSYPSLNNREPGLRGDHQPGPHFPHSASFATTYGDPRFTSSVSDHRQAHPNIPVPPGDLLQTTATPINCFKQEIVTPEPKENSFDFSSPPHTFSRSKSFKYDNFKNPQLLGTDVLVRKSSVGDNNLANHNREPPHKHPRLHWTSSAEAFSAQKMKPALGRDPTDHSNSYFDLPQVHAGNKSSMHDSSLYGGQPMSTSRNCFESAAQPISMMNSSLYPNPKFSESPPFQVPQYPHPASMTNQQCHNKLDHNMLQKHDQAIGMNAQVSKRKCDELDMRGNHFDHYSANDRNNGYTDNGHFQMSHDRSRVDFQDDFRSASQSGDVQGMLGMSRQVSVNNRLDSPSPCPTPASMISNDGSSASSQRSRFSPALIKVLIDHVLDSAQGGNVAEKLKQKFEQNRIDQSVIHMVLDLFKSASKKHTDGNQTNSQSDVLDVNLLSRLPENRMEGMERFLKDLNFPRNEDQVKDMLRERGSKSEFKLNQSFENLDMHSSNMSSSDMNVNAMSPRDKVMDLSVLKNSIPLDRQTTTSSHMRSSITSVGDSLDLRDKSRISSPSDLHHSGHSNFQRSNSESEKTWVSSSGEFDAGKLKKISDTIDSLSIGMKILHRLKPEHRESLKLFKQGRAKIRVLTDSDRDVKEAYKKIMEGIPHLNERIFKFCDFVPGFSDLSAKDREKMLQRAYYDIWMITFAEYFQGGKSYIILHSGEIYSLEAMRRILNDEEIINTIYSFAQEFNALALTDLENSLLCAVCLTSCDGLDLVDRDTIDQLHSHLLDVLAFQVKVEHPENHSRLLIDIFRLMPTLAVINNMQKTIITEFSVSRFEDDEESDTVQNSNSDRREPSNPEGARVEPHPGVRVEAR